MINIRRVKLALIKKIPDRVTIIDEIGYTPIERRQANQFFNLIGELYEHTSIIITSTHLFPTSI